jgi:hypothetical protein
LGGVKVVLWDLGWRWCEGDCWGMENRQLVPTAHKETAWLRATFSPAGSPDAVGLMVAMTTTRGCSAPSLAGSSTRFISRDSRLSR